MVNFPDETNDPIYITIADTCPPILENSISNQSNNFQSNNDVQVKFNFDPTSWASGNKLVLVKNDAPVNLSDSSYNVLETW